MVTDVCYTSWLTQMAKGQENLEWEGANGHWCLLQSEWTLIILWAWNGHGLCRALSNQLIVFNLTHIALLVKQGTFLVYKHKKIAAFRPFGDTCIWKDSQAYELFRICLSLYLLITTGQERKCCFTLHIIIVHEPSSAAKCLTYCATYSHQPGAATHCATSAQSTCPGVLPHCATSAQSTCPGVLTHCATSAQSTCPGVLTHCATSTQSVSVHLVKLL